MFLPAIFLNMAKNSVSEYPLLYCSEPKFNACGALMLSGTVASMSSRTELKPTNRAISSASSFDAELCLRSNVSSGPKDSTEICLEKILFDKAAVTTFTLPVVEVTSPIIDLLFVAIVANVDVDARAPETPTDELPPIGCANARRRSVETPRREDDIARVRSVKKAKAGATSEWCARALT